MFGKLFDVIESKGFWISRRVRSKLLLLLSVIAPIAICDFAFFISFLRPSSLFQFLLFRFSAALSFVVTLTGNTHHIAIAVIDNGYDDIDNKTTLETACWRHPPWPPTNPTQQ